jgi:peroxiredoxin
MKTTLRILSAIACLCVPALGCGGSETASGGEANTAADTGHPLIGNSAPTFEIASVNNKGKVSLANLNGKVVIVDFWATWCEPCKKSFPKLQDLYGKFKGSGLQIVALSEDDDKSGIPEFGTSYGAEFPLLWDSDKAVAGKYNPGSMPATFIIDRKGVVRFLHRGYHDNEEVEIEKEIQGLL